MTKAHGEIKRDLKVYADFYKELERERERENRHKGESSKAVNAAMRAYVPPDDSIKTFNNSRDYLDPTYPYGENDLPTMDDSRERTYFGSEGPLNRPEQRGDREHHKKPHSSVGRPHVRRNRQTYISEHQISELVRVVEQEDQSMESVAIHYVVTEKVCQDKYNKYLEKEFRGY